MKWSVWVIGMAAAVTVAAPTAAQQSLGDVAGSIKLKRPEGESVVVDRDTVGKTRRARTGVTEDDFFRDAVNDCLTETRALSDLLAETRDGTSFYRDEWRGRVAEVGLRLDGARQDLGMVAAEGRLLDAYEMAERGANTAAAALEILRGAIADDRPVFSQAGTLSKEAVRLFGDAEAAIGVALRADAAEDTPPPINPIDADRAITGLCRGRYSDGSNGFTSCVAEQNAAVDAMTGRFAPGVGLDAISFNVIRNNCRFEWPDNYVSQDRCERQRVASKKSR